jgi:hypothetical protein
MAALPVLKLFFLGVKQLSKPVAGFIKNRAKNSPAFKEQVINAAQFWHRINVRASQAASGASAETRALRVKPLDEATAVATFTDILGEGVIYFVAAVALVVEYQMSAEKDAKKAAALEQRFKNAEAMLASQKNELDALRAELKFTQHSSVHVSQDALELMQVLVQEMSSLVFKCAQFLLQGHCFSPEAIALRRERLATYVSSIHGFADDHAIRADTTAASEASSRVPISDRWLQKIRGMLSNKAAVDSASGDQKH